MQYNGITTATNTLKAVPCLRQQGIQVVGRYYSRINTWKCLTIPEAQQLAAHQMRIIAIWQESADRAAYFTKQRGLTDGLGACQVAHALGQPRQTPVYFAVDYDALPADRERLHAYFHGVHLSLANDGRSHASHPYHIGVYGSTWVLDWCQTRGMADYFMQAYPRGWAGGANARTWPGVHVQQLSSNRSLCAIAVDHLQVNPDSGGWLPHRPYCPPSGTML